MVSCLTVKEQQTVGVWTPLYGMNRLEATADRKPVHQAGCNGKSQSDGHNTSVVCAANFDGLRFSCAQWKFAIPLEKYSLLNWFQKVTFLLRTLTFISWSCNSCTCGNWRHTTVSVSPSLVPISQLQTSKLCTDPTIMQLCCFR